MQNVLRLVGALGVSLSLVSQKPHPGRSLPSGELVGKINHVLSWKAFWEGMDSFNGKYVAGKRVDAKVIWTPREVAVFIGAVGVNIVLRRDSRSLQFHPALWSYMADDTNESAARRYVRDELMRPGDGDCVPLSKTPPQQGAEQRKQPGNVLPAKPICPDEHGGAVLSEENISLELPILEEPFDTNPPAEPDQLRSATAKALSYYLGEQCPAASITIPRFSVDDPQVYVVVDLGHTCGRGVYAVRRDSTGAWKAGKLWLDGPPNDLTRIIRQIENNALQRFRFPGPH